MAISLTHMCTTSNTTKFWREEIERIIVCDKEKGMFSIFSFSCTPLKVGPLVKLSPEPFQKTTKCVPSTYIQVFIVLKSQHG